MSQKPRRVFVSPRSVSLAMGLLLLGLVGTGCRPLATRSYVTLPIDDFTAVPCAEHADRFATGEFFLVDSSRFEAPSDYRARERLQSVPFCDPDDSEETADTDCKWTGASCYLTFCDEFDDCDTVEGGSDFCDCFAACDKTPAPCAGDAAGSGQ